MSLDLSLRLVVQSGDHYTMPEGGVPVIYQFTNQPHQFAVVAVNFLRSGCPEVQVVVSPGVCNDFDVVADVIEPIEQLITTGLQLPSEVFEFETLAPRVYRIRRRVVPQPPAALPHPG
jgi:hypothetical protein